MKHAKVIIIINKIKKLTSNLIEISYGPTSICLKFIRELQRMKKKKEEERKKKKRREKSKLEEKCCDFLIVGGLYIFVIIVMRSYTIFLLVFFPKIIQIFPFAKNRF